MEQKKKLVIVSGLSGSGKTIALRALEDLGFYCIDNLPSALLLRFVESFESNELEYSNVALSLDCRDKNMPQTFVSTYSRLNGVSDLDLIFLTARDEIILKRFKETRRQHPLVEFKNKNNQEEPLFLSNLVREEREMLRQVQSLASIIIDTSEMSAPLLRRMIRNDFSTFRKESMIMTLCSFGFKYGTPPDLDIVLDARCFENPFYFPDLRSLSGFDQAVKDFVFNDVNVPLFVEKIENLIYFLHPLYQKEGKNYLSVGVGCTGGRHRSVAIVEELVKRLTKVLNHIQVEHRNVDL